MTPELLILVGIPASGKSTYAKRQTEHVIVSKDSREKQRMREIADARSAGFSVIVDERNLTVVVRAPLIAHAMRLHMRPIAVYFEPNLEASTERNMGRPKQDRVPEFVVHNMFRSMEPPRLDEGFEEIRHVRC